MSGTEQKKEFKKNKRISIKNLYIKIFIPVFLIILTFLISSILYAFLFPSHIYFIKNQSEISKMHEELLNEKVRRIELLNNKIDSIDNDYLENETINYDKYIQLRNALENERNSLWKIK